MSKKQIQEYLIGHILDNLVIYVMEDQQIGLQEAIKRIYESPILPMLQDEKAELYVQSPAYVYALYQQQKQTKSI